MSDKSKMITQYRGATITFSEAFSKAFPYTELEPTLDGDILVFAQNSLQIRAYLQINIGESYVGRVEDDIPALVDLIMQDLDSIEGYIGELRELAKCGTVEPCIHFLQKPVGVFYFFDYSKRYNHEHLFDRLRRILEIPTGFLTNKQFELYNLAEHTDKWTSYGLCFVKGETLEEATKKAMLIYKNADKIRALPFEK